jgi:REP element-mobilizing transposase RayT
MDKKESYRHLLPHFQQPGQAYFVTWSLMDALPPKALSVYTQQLKNIASNIQIAKEHKKDEKTLDTLKLEYAVARRKYIKAFDDLLHVQTKSIVDLSKDENTKSVLSALNYWDGKQLENYAICVMNNHVHWVFRLYDKDESGQPVYLQDILQSVKRFSANQLNDNEGRKGTVWQKESWDTTIRDNKHLQRAVEYTINNPVEAGLVTDWKQWKGTVLF